MRNRLYFCQFKVTITKMNNFTKLLLVLSVLACACGSPTEKKAGFGPGEQDWGWVNVRKGANLFYWLFFTTANVSSFYDRPLLVWLQGGPGGSATGYGNFAEIGPLYTNLTERPDSWTKHVNVVFLDSPVGAGYSYVDNFSYLNKDNIEIAKDFMVFITEFYKRHPGFKKTPLYLFGESYGGKLAVEMAKQLDERIKAGGIESNLKGVILLDSWISPVDSFYGWAPLLLNLGLIDERQSQKLTETANNIKKTMDTGKYTQATIMWRAYESEVMMNTGGVDFYNILDKVSPVVFHDNESPMNLWAHVRGKVEDELRDIGEIMNGPVKSALKIPKHLVHGANFLNVFNNLREDFLKPVTHVVEHLLNNTNVEVHVLSGQLDLIVDTYGTLRWVNRLRWKGSSSWASAKKTPLVLKGYIEGYITKADKLSFYSIIRTGHMIPKDNGPVAMEILRRATKFDAK